MMRRHHRPARAQRGVVLFIALIVLVAMALASVAMRRSVDTSLGIAGNLAFRQSSLQSTDEGVNSAYTNYISNPPNCPDGTQLTCNDTANGYFAALPVPETTNWFDPAVWQNNTVDVYAGGTDRSGNRVRYIMHRMCVQTGSSNNPSPQQCALYVPMGGGASGSTQTVGSYQFAGQPMVYIRITTRVDGPRNTVSISQATVLVNAQ